MIDALQVMLFRSLAEHSAEWRLYLQRKIVHSFGRVPPDNIEARGDRTGEQTYCSWLGKILQASYATIELDGPKSTFADDSKVLDGSGFTTKSMSSASERSSITDVLASVALLGGYVERPRQHGLIWFYNADSPLSGLPSTTGARSHALRGLQTNVSIGEIIMMPVKDTVVVRLVHAGEVARQGSDLLQSLMVVCAADELKPTSSMARSPYAVMVVPASKVFPLDEIAPSALTRGLACDLDSNSMGSSDQSAVSLLQTMIGLVQAAGAWEQSASLMSPDPARDSSRDALTSYRAVVCGWFEHRMMRALSQVLTAVFSTISPLEAVLSPFCDRGRTCPAPADGTTSLCGLHAQLHRSLHSCASPTASSSAHPATDTQRLRSIGIAAFHLMLAAAAQPIPVQARFCGNPRFHAADPWGRRTYEADDFVALAVTFEDAVRFLCHVPSSTTTGAILPSAIKAIATSFIGKESDGAQRGSAAESVLDETWGVHRASPAFEPDLAEFVPQRIDHLQQVPPLPSGAAAWGPPRSRLSLSGLAEVESQYSFGSQLFIGADADATRSWRPRACQRQSVWFPPAVDSELVWSMVQSHHQTITELVQHAGLTSEGCTRMVWQTVQGNRTLPARVTRIYIRPPPADRPDAASTLASDERAKLIAFQGYGQWRHLLRAELVTVDPEWGVQSAPSEVSLSDVYPAHVQPFLSFYDLSKSVTAAASAHTACVAQDVSTPTGQSRALAVLLQRASTILTARQVLQHLLPWDPEPSSSPAVDVPADVPATWHTVHQTSVSQQTWTQLLTLARLVQHLNSVPIEWATCDDIKERLHRSSPAGFDSRESAVHLSARCFRLVSTLLLHASTSSVKPAPAIASSTFASAAMVAQHVQDAVRLTTIANIGAHSDPLGVSGVVAQLLQSGVEFLQGTARTSHIVESEKRLRRVLSATARDSLLGMGPNLAATLCVVIPPSGTPADHQSVRSVVYPVHIPGAESLLLQFDRNTDFTAVSGHVELYHDQACFHRVANSAHISQHDFFAPGSISEGAHAGRKDRPSHMSSRNDFVGPGLVIPGAKVFIRFVRRNLEQLPNAHSFAGVSSKYAPAEKGFVIRVTAVTWAWQHEYELLRYPLGRPVFECLTQMIAPANAQTDIDVLTSRQMLVFRHAAFPPFLEACLRYCRLPHPPDRDVVLLFLTRMLLSACATFSLVPRPLSASVNGRRITQSPSRAVRSRSASDGASPAELLQMSHDTAWSLFGDSHNQLAWGLLVDAHQSFQASQHGSASMYLSVYSKALVEFVSAHLQFLATRVQDDLILQSTLLPAPAITLQSAASLSSSNSTAGSIDSAGAAALGAPVSNRAILPRARPFGFVWTASPAQLGIPSAAVTDKSVDMRSDAAVGTAAAAFWQSLHVVDVLHAVASGHSLPLQFCRYALGECRNLSLLRDATIHLESYFRHELVAAHWASAAERSWVAELTRVRTLDQLVVRISEFVLALQSSKEALLPSWSSVSGEWRKLLLSASSTRSVAECLLLLEKYIQAPAMHRRWSAQTRKPWRSALKSLRHASSCFVSGLKVLVPQVLWTNGDENIRSDLLYLILNRMHSHRFILAACVSHIVPVLCTFCRNVRCC